MTYDLKIILKKQKKTFTIEFHKNQDLNKRKLLKKITYNEFENDLKIIKNFY